MSDRVMTPERVRAVAQFIEAARRDPWNFADVAMPDVIAALDAAVAAEREKWAAEHENELRRAHLQGAIDAAAVSTGEAAARASFSDVVRFINEHFQGHFHAGERLAPVLLRLLQRLAASDDAVAAERERCAKHLERMGIEAPQGFVRANVAAAQLRAHK